MDLDAARELKVGDGVSVAGTVVGTSPDHVDIRCFNPDGRSEGFLSVPFTRESVAQLQHGQAQIKCVRVEPVRPVVGPFGYAVRIVLSFPLSGVEIGATYSTWGEGENARRDAINVANWLRVPYVGA